ncbi:MAG: hypothetical protein ACREKH_21345 [Candidatus Rokuibacteriota bacterium]
MADSEPAVYSAPVSRSLVATTARGIRPHTKLIALRYGLPTALWISAPTPMLAFVATQFLPAPRVHEAR